MNEQPPPPAPYAPLSTWSTTAGRCRDCGRRNEDCLCADELRDRHIDNDRDQGDL